MVKRFFVGLVLLTGCGGPEYKTEHFRAISLDKKDTAVLTLQVSASAFYGDYQITYEDKSRDDGDVSGLVHGDTLTGKYVFLSRENVRSTAPVVFLRAGKNLKLGTGQAGKYMGFNVYQSGSVSFNDSLFQFNPVHPEQ